MTDKKIVSLSKFRNGISIRSLLQICIISKAGITFGAQGICNHPSSFHSGKSAGMITFQICASVKYSQMNFSWWRTLSLPNRSTWATEQNYCWSKKICSSDNSFRFLDRSVSITQSRRGVSMGCSGFVGGCLWNGPRVSAPVLWTNQSICSCATPLSL